MPSAVETSSIYPARLGCDGKRIRGTVFRFPQYRNTAMTRSIRHVDGKKKECLVPGFQSCVPGTARDAAVFEAPPSCPRNENRSGGRIRTFTDRRRRPPTLASCSRDQIRHLEDRSELTV